MAFVRESFDICYGPIYFVMFYFINLHFVQMCIWCIYVFDVCLFAVLYNNVMVHFRVYVLCCVLYNVCAVRVRVSSMISYF